jgi:predicted permease
MTPARLRRGVTIGEAQAELQTISQRLAREFPDTNATWSVEVSGLRENVAGTTWPLLATLQIAVGFVLLIACANVAGLLTLRAERRRQELTMRAALGATRGALARGLLLEGLAVALAGGLVGLPLAAWSTRVLMAHSALARLPLTTLPSLFRHPSVDYRVLAFGVAITLASGSLIGSVLALRVSRGDRFELLRHGSRAAGGAGRQRLLQTVAVVEVALAMVLLVGAGLAVKSLYRLYSVDLGFNPGGTLTVTLGLPGREYREAHQRTEFVDRVLERVRELPEVASAAVTTSLPMETIRPRMGSFTIKDRPSSSPSEVLFARYYLTSADYLEAMGIGLAKGRFLSHLDHQEAPGVVVVSQAMARSYWPGEDPLGKQLKRGGPDSRNPWLSVVGVAEDVRDAGAFADTEPVYYLPYAQHAASPVGTELVLLVRTRGRPEGLASAVRRQVWQVDRKMAASRVSTLERHLAGSLARFHLTSFLLNIFSAFALLLSLAGIYAVVSYAAAQRRQEMGVRMALGARRRDVLALVLGQGMKLAVAGLAIGVGLSVVAGLSLARLLSSQLFGVSPLDLPTLAVAALALAAMMAGANVIPALRTARVDPIVALRYP